MRERVERDEAEPGRVRNGGGREEGGREGIIASGRAFGKMP